VTLGRRPAPRKPSPVDGDGVRRFVPSHGVTPQRPTGSASQLWGSVGKTAPKQSCQEREGQFVVKGFFFFLDFFFFPSCISLRAFVDSVGRAKWKEFTGRRQFRVTAQYANINQAVADGTKQMPSADAGPQMCDVGPAPGAHGAAACWLCVSGSQQLRRMSGACPAPRRMGA